MSAKLLRSTEDEERGLTGWLNHHFDRLQAAYGRALAAPWNACPAVYLVWLVVSLCTIPMYNFSPNELAPVEDQSVPAASSTWPRTPPPTRTWCMARPPSRYHAGGAGSGADLPVAVSAIHRSDHRRRRLQRRGGQTLGGAWPHGRRYGAGGAGTGPKIPGIQVFITMPPALPGGSNFPVELVITSTADADRPLEFARILQQKPPRAACSAFPPDIDLKIDQPQAAVVFDRDKLSQILG